MTTKYRLTGIGKNKAYSFAVLALILFLMPLLVNAEVHKDKMSSPEINSEIKNDKVELLVKEVLMHAETSIAHVESNTARSLSHVEKALAGIKDIKSNLSPDTHAERKSPMLVEESKEYWFIYPRVNQGVLKNKESFPTLHTKFETGILYHGEEENRADAKDSTAYFDYAFAYASLITAREALIAKNYREARSSLKWVFESVYVNPDFYVAEYNHQLKIDTFHNLNAFNPVQFSQVN